MHQTSNLVFEIVVRDAQEACQLAQTIHPHSNSESTPCSHDTTENTENIERFTAETSKGEVLQIGDSLVLQQGPPMYDPSTRDPKIALPGRYATPGTLKNAPKRYLTAVGQDPSEPSSMGSKPSASDWHDWHQLELTETTLLDIGSSATTQSAAYAAALIAAPTSGVSANSPRILTADEPNDAPAAPTPAPTHCQHCQDFDAHLEGGDYPSEVSWCVGEGNTTYTYSASPQTVSLPPGESTLYMIDSFGDGWNGASWTLKETGGEVVVAGPFTFSSGASATEIFTAWTGPTAAPTAVPTNVGDTDIPTALPTPAPPLDINSILNWADLKATCSDSDCDTANGGCTITLSEDFVMGSYTSEISEISFSGKNITIWGQGKVLDASGGGRFFNGNGAGSLLVLHDVVLQNGYSNLVSGRVLVVAIVIELISPDPSLQFPAADPQSTFLGWWSHLH
jgi:hypothetical protein